MKVSLLKKEEVDFNLAEDKCEKLSHNMLRLLIGYKVCEHVVSENPKMVVFKTKEEYKAEASKYNIDTDKEVLINQKGNIFCYLKTEDTTKAPNKSEEPQIESNTE